MAAELFVKKGTTIMVVPFELCDAGRAAYPASRTHVRQEPFLTSASLSFDKVQFRNAHIN